MSGDDATEAWLIKMGQIGESTNTKRSLAVDIAAPNISSSSQQIECGRDPSHVEMVSQVILGMKRAVNGRISLPEWANYASTSKFELTLAFKKLTGIPPMMFHNAERIELAKRLLVFEKLSVTDTCFEIGFESLGSFVTKFTQWVGVSPLNYARAMRDASLQALFATAMMAIRRPKVPADPATRLCFDARVKAGRSLIAAVFPRPFPAGYPSTWAFVPGGVREVRFAGRPTGHCMVASMPFPHNAKLVNFRPDIVGRATLSGSLDPQPIDLRGLSIFDPPITLAVPLLFCRKAAELTKS